jgi:hypothetical protein
MVTLEIAPLIYVLYVPQDVPHVALLQFVWAVLQLLVSNIIYLMAVAYRPVLWECLEIQVELHQFVRTAHHLASLAVV